MRRSCHSSGDCESTATAGRGAAHHRRRDGLAARSLGVAAGGRDVTVKSPAVRLAVESTPPVAPKDSLGYFTAGSIRDALEIIAGRRIEIPAFALHLSKFLEPERRSVLQREGSERRWFYRLANPLLQPYVVLTGLSAGTISEGRLARIQGSTQMRETDDV
jgi:hypothetical protein